MVNMGISADNDKNLILLSSIVIAKNEEANIRLCLDSQLYCIDDIVVCIDEESTDNTLDLVKKYKNVNWSICKWKGFSGTKQEALKKTKYDWVFWIDADEVITNSLSEELIRFKTLIPDHDVYSVARRAYFLNKWIKHSGWYPGRVERLFNKTKVCFSKNNVHEHLIYKGEAGLLNSDLEHHTDPTIEHYFKKFNEYTSLAAHELADKNRRVYFTDFLFRPLGIFIKMYFIKLGFLDGFHGLILAVFSSFYVLVKYSKLWEINRRKK
jgi:glycosyltransferase involved in cell wall biosynthesis